MPLVAISTLMIAVINAQIILLAPSVVEPQNFRNGMQQIFRNHQPAMLALIRMFGGLLASTGILSALIARDPERDRGFVVAFTACLLLNVGADVVVIGAGELRFDQLAVGMLLELVLAIVLVVYGSVAKRATI